MNPILLTSVAAWLIAQVGKVVVAWIRTRTVELRLLTTTGGMPSAHSALVASLTVGVGLAEGTGSPVFAVAFVFSMIVFYDAAGVRRAAGEQAEVLNQMLRDLYIDHEFRPERLRELLGHTPVEVLAGIGLGGLLAWTGWLLGRGAPGG
ncbi:MAG TPA: divergent PAP2 family protein [Bacillota bacterium]|nr:divergent PAP2 family protein [Bacillota bacterium]